MAPTLMKTLIARKRVDVARLFEGYLRSQAKVTDNDLHHSGSNEGGDILRGEELEWWSYHLLIQSQTY